MSMSSLTHSSTGPFSGVAQPHAFRRQYYFCHDRIRCLHIPTDLGRNSEPLGLVASSHVHDLSSVESSLASVVEQP